MQLQIFLMNTKTHHFLQNGFHYKRKSLICRRLKFYETALKDFGFCRVHRSFLVNLEYVKRYLKGKGGSAILEDGTKIMVANNRKGQLMEQLKG